LSGKEKPICESEITVTECCWCSKWNEIK
jgi:hypothetical protein